jgi:hypothetical protein
MDYLKIDADDIISRHAVPWLACIESYKNVRKSVLAEDWILDYDSTETCIYRLRYPNPCNAKRIIVAFRGTADSKDLYDDWKITINQVFPRALEAVVFLKWILDKEPDITILLTGHSLGGAVAREAGKQLELGFPVVTFNAAAPPTAPAFNGTNEIAYHIVFDIISAWQGPSTVRIDKGFKPIPRWWERALTILWLNASLSDLAKAHELKNFSNQVSGRVVCSDEETKSMDRWISSLPFNLRSIVYVSLFGLGAGSFGLPNLEGGCFGG